MIQNQIVSAIFKVNFKKYNTTQSLKQIEPYFFMQGTMSDESLTEALKEINEFAVKSQKLKKIIEKYIPLV